MRKPLGQELTPDQLEADATDILIAAIGGPDVVGTMILTALDPQTLKMRQVAVAAALQGSGIGQKMVHFSEQWARNNGYTHITLHAREVAIPFYLKLGYTICSEEFIEVTIPHRKMEKQLAD